MVLDGLLDRFLGLPWDTDAILENVDEGLLVAIINPVDGSADPFRIHIEPGGLRLRADPMPGGIYGRGCGVRV